MSKKIVVVVLILTYIIESIYVNIVRIREYEDLERQNMMLKTQNEETIELAKRLKKDADKVKIQLDLVLSNLEDFEQQIQCMDN